MTREKAIEKIVDYFRENPDDFNEVVEELDEYNGYLGDDRVFSMDLLDEFYNGAEPLEILRRAFYGRDDDTYTTDAHGERHHAEFNPNRDYFYYNGYGNFVSTDRPDYSARLDHYAVEAIAENRDYLDAACLADDELCALFDALDEDEDEEGGACSF